MMCNCLFVVSGGPWIVSNYAWASLRKVSGAYKNVLEGLENVSVGSFWGLWKLQKNPDAFSDANMVSVICL